MKYRMSFRGGLAAVLLVWAASGSAQAPAVRSISEAMARDARAYAEVFGASAEEALRRLEIQERVGILDELLAVEAKATFGGLWIEHQPELRVIALFTDAAEGRQLLSEAALGDLKAPVEVRPARWSLGVLTSRLGDVEKQLRSLGAVADLWINVRSNRVEILTPNPDELTAALLAESKVLPPATAVVEIDSLPRPQVDIRGGRPIADYGALTACTAGFTVRSSTGQLGLATAGHCDNNQTYQDFNRPLSFRSERFRGSHDVQWHAVACDDDVRNQVYDGSGYRTINGSVGRGAQAIGSLVCKFGRTTGYTCGTVLSKSYCPSYIPSGNSTFIAVGGSPDLSAPGDSGGPWFVGNRAYGIHSGGNSSGLAIYMAVDYMSSQGYSVLNYAAGVNPYPTITCEPGTYSFSCSARGHGGNSPYTFSDWTYYGPAATWNSSGSTIYGDYGGFPGCAEGSYNSVSVRVTDSCGRSGLGIVEFYCPETSCGENEICFDPPF